MFTSLTDSRTATLATILDEPPGVWECEVNGADFMRVVAHAQLDHAYRNRINHVFVVRIDPREMMRQVEIDDGTDYASWNLRHHPPENLILAATIRAPSDVSTLGDLLACPAALHAVRFAGDCEVDLDAGPQNVLPGTPMPDGSRKPLFSERTGYRKKLGWVYTAPCEVECPACGGSHWIEYGDGEGYECFACGDGRHAQNAPPAVYDSLAAQCRAAGVPYWQHNDPTRRELPAMVESINSTQTDRRLT